MQIDEEDARAGQTGTGLRIVLAVSTIAAAIALFLIFGGFAAT